MARTGSRKPTPDKAPTAKGRRKSASLVAKPSEHPTGAPATTNFAIGDGITHPLFGDGRVTSISDDKLTINFKNAGIKVIVDGFVKRAR